MSQGALRSGHLPPAESGGAVGQSAEAVPPVGDALREASRELPRTVGERGDAPMALICKHALVLSE
jgi:hypothetical protein